MLPIKQESHHFEAPTPSVDFLPKLLKVEELSEAESWVDFEAIFVPIHKVFVRDFIQYEVLWVVFPPEKENCEFNTPTLSYEFSSISAWSWRVEQDKIVS